MKTKFKAKIVIEVEVDCEVDGNPIDLSVMSLMLKESEEASSILDLVRQGGYHNSGITSTKIMDISCK